MAKDTVVAELDLIGRHLSVPYNPEGSKVSLRVMRDGSVITTPLALAWQLEGRVFVTQAGTLTTPITGTAGAPDNLQPDFALRVPDGTKIVPIYMSFVGEASAGTVTEMIFGVGDTDLGNGTSGAATVAPLNTHVARRQRVSRCVARQEYTANGSAFDNFFEFTRRNDLAEPLDTLQWSLGSQLWTPVIEGPATVYAHWAATTTAPTGFLVLVYAEFRADEV